MTWCVWLKITCRLLSLSQVLFISAIVFYEDLETKNYVYPRWSINVGLLLTASSLMCIPLYLVYLFLMTPGTFCQVWWITFMYFSHLFEHKLNSVVRYTENTQDDKAHRLIWYNGLQPYTKLWNDSLKEAWTYFWTWCKRCFSIVRGWKLMKKVKHYLDFGM